MEQVIEPFELRVFADSSMFLYSNPNYLGQYIKIKNCFFIYNLGEASTKVYTKKYDLKTLTLLYKLLS